MKTTRGCHDDNTSNSTIKHTLVYTLPRTNWSRHFNSKDWLKEKFNEQQIEIKSIRESNSKDIRNSHLTIPLPTQFDMAGVSLQSGHMHQVKKPK